MLQRCSLLLVLIPVQALSSFLPSVTFIRFSTTAVADEDDSAEGSAEAETGVAGTLLAALGKVPDAAPAGGIDDDDEAE